jgi:hypothetical protein
MARDENPPFRRGETFYQGNTIDVNNLGGVQLEGKEYTFEDIDPRAGTSGATARRTSRSVRCRIVRNVGTLTLLAKRAVMVGSTAGKVWSTIDGNGFNTDPDDIQGIVDEYLPSTGCLPNDLCYIVVRGPSLCLTGLAGDATNVINVKDRLVVLAGTSSGSTTSGRVGTQILTGATAPLAKQIQNVLGRAMSAKTTSNTNNDLLVDVYCGK